MLQLAEWPYSYSDKTEDFIYYLPLNRDMSAHRSATTTIPFISDGERYQAGRKEPGTAQTTKVFKKIELGRVCGSSREYVCCAAGPTAEKLKSKESATNRRKGFSWVKRVDGTFFDKGKYEQASKKVARKN